MWLIFNRFCTREIAFSFQLIAKIVKQMKKINFLLTGLCIGLFSACRVVEEPALPPELAAVTVADMTVSSAGLGSAVNKSGNQDIQEHGFLYSEKEGDADGVKTAYGAIDPTQPTPIGFTEALSGLKINTTYFVRSYAVTRLGTVYSEERSFKTLNIVQPGIRTDGSEAVTHNSARLKGTLTAPGTYPITQYGIVWGAAANPTVSLSTKVAVNANVSTFPTSFSANAESLSPATTYNFRAYVIANNVVTYGANMTFRTGDIQQPGIRTDASSQITVNSARLSGTVLSKGTFPVTEYGICWGTGANPTTAGSKFTQRGDVATVPASFATTASGLNANTVYYYRAYVISNNVTTYGADQSFRTSAVVQPQITTGGSGGITINSARLDGTLTSGGSYPITEYGVCWGTSANPTTANSKASESGNVTSFPRSFTFTAGGLNAATTYHYRAYVIANGVTTYGSNQTFRTADPVPPRVTTVGAVRTASFRFDGRIDEGGSYGISEYGICYATNTNNPTTANSKLSTSRNPGSYPFSYSFTLTNVTGGVNYFYRAYVISNGVSYYGNVSSISTGKD